MLRFSTLLWTLLVVSQGFAANVHRSSYVPVVPPDGEPSCAHGRTYCEDVTNYPREIIEKLVMSVPQEISSFLLVNGLDNSNDGQHGKNWGRSTFPSNFHANTSTMSVGKREKQLCESVIRIIKPLAARNEKNEWRYIVNVKNGEQIQTIEYCKREENECSSEFTLETHARCEQKMMLRRLLALDPSGKKLAWHDALMPTCCQCILYDAPWAPL